jgi:heptosyltransferase-3
MIKNIMDSNSIQKILIIIVSRIGDTLLTTPAIESISGHYKDTEITVLAHPKRYTLLQHLPFVHNVGFISKNTAIWKGRFGKKYDLAFVYGYDKNLVLYALRVSNRVIAFKQGNNKIDNRLYKSVELPTSKNMHFVDVSMVLPQAIDIHADNKRLSLSLTKDDELFAENILTENKLSNKLLIGIQAVSFPTKAYRDWPTECFLELCKKIIDKNPNVHFLIYGGRAEKEKEKLDWLFNSLSGYATSFIGMPLRETAAVMSKTRLYIGVDTGPSHIMSTFNIPMIVLFHCNLKSEIYGALEHPCYFAIDHPNKKNCSETSAMSDISVKKVLEAVDSVLKNL